MSSDVDSTDADVDRLRAIDCECLKKLIAAGKQFNDSGTELRTKLRLRGEMLQYLRTMIKERYDFLIRLDAQAADYDVNGCKNDMNFFELYLQSLHQCQPLSADFVKWFISKLLLSRTSKNVNRKIGGLLQQTILNLVRLLSPNDSEAFLAHIVQQLLGMVQGATRISLLNLDNETVELYRVHVPVVELTGGRITVFDSLLDLLHHGNFDMTTLSPHSLLMLWMVLVKVYAMYDVQLRTACVLLSQRLLSMDLANVLVCRLMMDSMLQVENHLRPGENYDTREGTEGLKQAHLSFFKVLTGLLSHFHDTRSLATIDLNTAVSWGHEASRLAILYPPRGSPSRLELLVCGVCEMLGRIDVKHPVASSEKVRGIVKNVQELIHKLLTVCDSDAMTLRLPPYFSLLMMIDEATDTRVRCDWLVSLCSQRTRDLAAAHRNVDAIRVRRAVLAALSPCDSEVARNALARLLPSTEYLLEVINKATSQRSHSLILALLAMVGDLAIDTSFPAALAVALLSLPWLVEPELQAGARRHHTSMPMLKELTKSVKICSTSLNDEVRASTLAPLARMTGCTEWRRTIYLAALRSDNLNIVQTALDNLASLVFSSDVSSFTILITAALELATERSRVDLCGVLAAVSASICATSPTYRSKDSVVDCELCRRVSAGEIMPTRSLEVPPRLLEVLKNAFKQDYLKGHEKQIRLESAVLLSSVMCHCHSNAALLSELPLEASLQLLCDIDEEVRVEYMRAFRLILRSPLCSSLTEEVKSLLIYRERPDDDDEVGEAAAHASTPFLVACVKESNAVSLRDWAFQQHFIVVFKFSNSKALVSSMRKLVRELAAKEFPKESHTTRLFAQKVRMLSEVLVEELLCVVNSLMSESDQETISEEIDDVLNFTAELFSFDGLPALLRACGKYVVTELFVPTEANRKAASIVLVTLRRHLRMTSSQFGAEYLPSVLLHRTLKSRARSDSDFNFVQQICGVNPISLTEERRYVCNVYLLQALSVNESSCLELLKKLNRKLYAPPFTLTKVLKINCEYLGVLLTFRQYFLDDEYYEMRPVLAASLSSIIRLLDNDFISKLANKLLIVLRAATTLGELAVSVWMAFVQRLDTKELAGLLPQILIAVQPLLEFDSSDELLQLIFDRDNDDEVDVEQIEKFERTALVLIKNEFANSSRIDKYLRRGGLDDSKESVIKACVRMLLEECETVGKVVLQKLITVLNGDPLEDDLTAQLVPALLHSLRRCGEAEVRLLAAKCLGRLGAVDPGRLGRSPDNTTLTNTPIVFVDDENFVIDLLERCWRVYSGVLNAVMIDQIEYCIQELLCRLVSTQDQDGILPRLSAECRRGIEPLRNTRLTSKNNPKPNIQSPIVDHVDSFPVWISHIYTLGAFKVREYPMQSVFRSLKWIVNTRDTVFTRNVLPQLILRLILESDEEVLEQYCSEMETVLRRVMDGGANWVQMAAHVVFSIMDTLELYAIRRKSLKRDNDKVLLRTQKFLARLIEAKWTDGSLLIVTAAEKCQCLYRALRWCEQHGIKKNARGEYAFDRSNYYALERLYTELHNVDGVLGAYECLAAHGVPTVDEQILALEANGDYNEALPLYSRCADNKELQLIKCLLRLNQPQLALSTATACYEQSGEGEDVTSQLAASQLEAAWHLRDWGRLEKMVKTKDALLSGQDISWGGACASIMCAVKQREPDTVSRRLRASRERLVERLTAMTIEHTDTYAQAYKYIAQLHILEEVEDSTSSLSLLDNGHPSMSPSNIQPVLKRWQSRSDSAVQCASVLEPILRVRRELLEISGQRGAENAISQLLIQSCRLARQAGHLQIAWTFLVEAKALNVNHKDVGMEEARFEFQKGNQQQAIGLLSKLMRGRFARMNDLFSKFVPYVAKGQSSSTSDFLKLTSREERAEFAEVQLLAAEYMMKAGAVGANEIYKIYMALRRLEVPSEDLFYRVAVFCDGVYSMDSENVKTELVVTILRTYCAVLHHGQSHLFHAMPRMLTLWLDVSQAKTESLLEREKKLPVQSSLSTRDTNDIAGMNELILQEFRQLNPYYFYTAFPQLISRIGHPSQAVFDTLKILLSELICKYPHQCLWQSIAVYRTGSYKKDLRQTRCTMVYNAARNKQERDRDGSNLIEQLIDQYDYIAALLIHFAEQSKMIPGDYSDLPARFPLLHKFFAEKTMDVAMLKGSKERRLEGVRRIQPSIMIPLTKMFENALPASQDVKVAYPSQFVMEADSPADNVSLSLPEVFVQSIEKNYTTMKSMQKPKRMRLLAADGRKHDIMCKPEDELRKDGRFMDVCRMMNSLMKKNADARRRQLMVRTFSVIPLQSKGGILEWVPDVAPYRLVLQPLLTEMGQPIVDNAWFKHIDNTMSDEEKVNKMKSFFHPKYPLVMSEWFRRQFTDPASWHSARSNFARSAAVMSMIGFVFGLGDRHGENVLINVKDGGVVHVDFNLLFNKGETLHVKEVVPFRLTRNMVDGLGPTGVEGVFRKSCEATLRVMRDNKDTLLTVVQAFVHDPLLEWMKTESRAQQNRGRQPHNSTAPSAVDHAHDAVSLIGKRLDGHIVTPDVHRQRYACAPMGIEGQVNKLIEIATDEVLLANMFMGWAPFI